MTGLVEPVKRARSDARSLDCVVLVKGILWQKGWLRNFQGGQVSTSKQLSGLLCA